MSTYIKNHHEIIENKKIEKNESNEFGYSSVLVNKLERKIIK